jgi:hypothetical protein
LCNVPDFGTWLPARGILRFTFQGAMMQSVFSMFSKREIQLLLAAFGLLALALFGPALAQPAHLHHFADQRELWGLPFAMDVLSNLPFALAGTIGIWLLVRLPSGTRGGVERSMAALFFAGLILTAGASSWYHLKPDDMGLAVDRLGMSVAFAGLLGLAAAGRVSDRAGAAAGVAVLLLAPAGVQAWLTTGNILPWAVVQFGGMGLILWLFVLRSGPGALEIRWGLVILAYAAAKLLEASDHAVYEFTDQWVSGHTLKHLAAALAALPVVSAVRALGRSAQKAASVRASDGIARRPASHA